ncbi:MAG: hypothetical protein ABSG86_08055 [Thermoguttaceae bacterium]|jgi:hypothetical protein
MTYRGHIKNGVAVPDERVNLPDGTPVWIEVERIDADFWSNRSAEEVARAQGVEPCVDPDDLAGQLPEDESLDDFLALIRRSRV